MKHDVKLLEKAINNITLAIRKYKGTYDEHLQLQNDLKLVIDTINTSIEEKKDEHDEQKEA